MARARLPPVARVRAGLAGSVGAARASSLPDGYQRLGRVLLIRIPRELWSARARIGELWCETLGVETVLARTGPVRGELREPSVVRIAGERTETEVVEHGVRWKLDAAKIMFAAGNRTERARARTLVGPGEHVADLFAGIGYFAVPAALSASSVRVVAVEKNPLAFRYLEENARLNGVAGRVVSVLGDNRTVELPARTFDRVFLGWLPDSSPWLGRALELLRPTGGTIHVHRVGDADEPTARAGRAVADALEQLGGRVLSSPNVREVKPYGPGRRHLVVDVAAEPN